MAKAINQQLTASRELSYVNQKDPLMGTLCRKIISAVNSLAKNAAVAAVGKLSPPPPIDSLTVQGALDPSTNTLTVPGEILHHTLTHNQAVQKGVQYISEIDTNPNFSQPHIIDHGSSRSSFVSLPSMQSDGATPNTYYLRSYAQYHGSDPSKPTVFGGVTGATKIVMGGTTATPMSLLPSTGSGTANPNGQQGAVGLGKVLNRPAPGPKRNLK